MTPPAASWHEDKVIDWISQYSAKQRSHDPIGIGDDASVHQPDPDHVEVVTCDALVENSHWSFAWCDYASVGYKAAAVNLSDLAAMGAVPQRAHLMLGIPPKTAWTDLRSLLKAMLDAFHKNGVHLAGGDTVASPGGMTLGVCLQGWAKKSEVVTRRQAQPNDLLLVTGSLGDAAAGFKILSQRPKLRKPFNSLVKHLLKPVPRLAEGLTLARSGKVHAMMDLSDGLAADLRKLLKSSRVGARIYSAQLPLSKPMIKAAAALHADPAALAMSGGEDYELLFAVPPQHAYRLIHLLQTRHKTRATIIGEVLPPSMGLSLINAHGGEVPMPEGWTHRG